MPSTSPAKERDRSVYWKGGKSQNHEKFHNNHQILNQSKRNINESGKMSPQQTVRANFLVDSGFSNMLNLDTKEINRKLLALINRKLTFKQ